MSKSSKVSKKDSQKSKDKSKATKTVKRGTDKISEKSDILYKVKFTDGTEYPLLDFDSSTDMPKPKISVKGSRSFIGSSSDDNNNGGTESSPSSETPSETFEGKGYKLTDKEVLKLAIACIQENGGTETGIKGEASLMCNLYQSRSSRYKNVLEYVMKGGWFGQATVNAVNSNKHKPTKSQLSWVKDVVVNGNRTLPTYINEHDCYSDISWIKNKGIIHWSNSYIKNPKNYIKDKTVVHNRYGSTWTFYCYTREDKSGDPYGYTSKK